MGVSPIHNLYLLFIIIPSRRIQNEVQYEWIKQAILIYTGKDYNSAKL